MEDEDTIVVRRAPIFWTWGVLGVLSVGFSAYHGYKRNNSVGAAVGWGVLGLIFPVIVPAVALAQGYGKRKR